MTFKEGDSRKLGGNTVYYCRQCGQAHMRDTYPDHCEFCGNILTGSQGFRASGDRVQVDGVGPSRGEAFNESEITRSYSGTSKQRTIAQDVPLGESGK